jgi:Mlc titration factor MtfA (ptsG expression regulator)
MFRLLTQWKRRRFDRRPFPPHWLPFVRDYVPFYRDLDERSRERFLRLVKVFVWEKHWIPAGGLEMTEEIPVVIAAAAVRLVMGLDLSYYDRLTEIIVYPSTYKHPDEDHVAVFGEAQTWGTIVLSWDAVKHGLSNPHDGHDTALHEFAHVLDIADGNFDGTPQLETRADYRSWVRVMAPNFHALRRRDRRQRQVLRMYGAENEAEFFAVATEAFFEKAATMKERTPALYKELSEFFQQDPASKSS